MAERLGRALQKLLHQFKSGRDLGIKDRGNAVLFYFIKFYSCRFVGDQVKTLRSFKKGRSNCKTIYSLYLLKPLYLLSVANYAISCAYYDSFPAYFKSSGCLYDIPLTKIAVPIALYGSSVANFVSSVRRNGTSVLKYRLNIKNLDPKTGRDIPKKVTYEPKLPTDVL